MSLAGGTASLPITDPTARATPLAPSQWRAMLREARSLGPGARGSAEQPLSDIPGAADSSNDAGAESAHMPTSQRERGGSSEAADAPQRPGYSSRPPLGPDGAPISTAASGQSWRSLGRRSSSDVAIANGSLSAQDASAPDRGSHSAPAGEAAEATAAAEGDARRRGVVVLDVRNGYEWDAGHFVGAERPAEVCTPSCRLCLSGFMACTCWTSTATTASNHEATHAKRGRHHLHGESRCSTQLRHPGRMIICRRPHEPAVCPSSCTLPDDSTHLLFKRGNGIKA